MNKLFLIFTLSLLFLTQSTQVQSQHVTATCDSKWEDVIFGNCIGKNNSLLPFDYQADGTVELIASAAVWAPNTAGYWYILKYNSTEAKYEKVYTSSTFESSIHKMTLFDIDGDGIDELALHTGNQLVIINLTTLAIIKTIPLPFSGGYSTHFSLADADNDGEDEIIVSNYDRLILINKNTFEVEQTFFMTAGVFAVGNVDADPNLEIVFVHGLAVEINPAGTMTTEYDFKPGNNLTSGLIELSNIDGDAYLEAIVTDSWNNLVTYDVEINAPKYEIGADLDIDAITVQDINNDGIDEIIFGDGQWGKIHCHNSITGNEIWEISNPNYGVTGIAFGDFDNDGTLEVAWGAGCTSSNADNLFVYNVSNQSPEWKSKHIDGPFNAVEVADIDQDGQKEIITVSFKSESGYACGIITVYDAITKEIEFQSSNNYFDFLPDFYNIEVFDYGNDGDLDIVLFADKFYATIWVIDGNTYAKESVYHATADKINDFYALAIADIDSDGATEFITSSYNKLYILNSTDYSIEWSSVTLTGNSLPTALFTGNIDDDSGSEIVLCKDYIYRFDDDNYTQNQTLHGDYTTLRLLDWDDSGDLEIIAGTAYGNIEVIDGTTLLAIDTLHISSKPIDGIGFADLNADGVMEIIATSDGSVYYIKKDGKYIKSQHLAAKLGKFDGLVIDDYDNDNQVDIIMGSSYGVIELDASCAQCLWFDAEITKTDPSCALDNGVLFGASSDNSTIFTVNGQSFTNSLPQLPADEYLVIATNNAGCKKEIPILLEQKNLITYVGWQNKSCLGSDDGMAFTYIQEGESPFVYTWSNGQATDTITNLAVGQYSVTVTDANNCTTQDTLNIEQSQILTTLHTTKPACSGMPNGHATVSIAEGQYPFIVEWDGVITGSNSNNSLSFGSHTVLTTDALGCHSTHNFVVDSATLIIKANPLSTSCNENNLGSAQVSIIEGTPPYYYYWSNNNFSNTIEAPADNYQVTVIDANNCETTDEVEILNTIQTTSNLTQLNCYGDDDGAAAVFATSGTSPFTYQWDTNDNSPSIENLSAGYYSVLIKDSNDCTIIKSIEITSPPEIIITLEIANDDLTTNELEGSILATVTGGTSPYLYSWNTGASINQITNLGEGIYTISITDSNQCLADTTIQLNIVSAITEIPIQLLKLFPNPSNGHFKIDYQGVKEIKDIQLFSMTGQSIPFDSKNLIRSSTVFVPNLSNGSYIFVFNIGDNYYFQKVTIERE